jgi:hypothetical protein
VKHLRYLSYLLRHKWWVVFAAVKMRLWPWGHPWLWLRLLVHDWSKCLPSEWIPYAESFYGPHEWKARPTEMKAAFNRAWLLHIHRQDHHWQHHCLLEDSGGMKVLEMGTAATLEMVCDWAGAGRAIQGRWDLGAWYTANRDRMHLGPETRRKVEGLIARHWTASPP